MPILGIVSSSTRQGLEIGSYESIATLTTAGSTLTFSNIPQTYKHLQIRFVGKNSNTTYQYVYLTMRLNSDTGANYDCHSMYATGSSIGSMYNGTYTDQMIIGPLISSGGGMSSQNSNPVIIDILDYTNTNKFKVIRALGGFDGNSPGEIRLASGQWKNTAAITSVSLNGADVQVNAALYGIKDS